MGPYTWGLWLELFQSFNLKVIRSVADLILSPFGSCRHIKPRTGSFNCLLDTA